MRDHIVGHSGATDHPVAFKECPVINSSHILVVAPDYGLRRSLEFALEVEGFAVVSFEDLATALASSLAADGRCIIVDEEALLNDPLATVRIQGLRKPTFLLIDRSRSVPQSLDIHILRKPVLGNALIRAVRAAEDGG